MLLLNKLAKWLHGKSLRPMNRKAFGILTVTGLAGLVGLSIALNPAHVTAQISNKNTETLELTNGMRYSGRLGSIESMTATAANLSADSSGYGITLIDDDMRKVFVSKNNVANKSPLDRFEEEFEIWQKVHRGDGLGTSIGQTLWIGPCDEFGRRAVTIRTNRGPKTVIQGITKINPRYVRFQGVVNSTKGGDERTWDVRESINSIPNDVLVAVLERQIRDVNDASERMRLVEFYIQASKFRLAKEALSDIRREFPGLKQELKKKEDELRGQVTRQALAEAKLRFQSGQPQLASSMLSHMNDTVDIASTILVEIADLRKQIANAYETVEVSRKTTLELVERVLAADTTSERLRESLDIFVQELESDLSLNTVDRLSTFVRFADDADQTDEQKISLALSGWLVGAGFNPKSLGESESLYRTRALVVEYLQSTRPERRLEILEELSTMETGAPEYLDRIIKHIKPPLAPSRNEISTVEPMEFTIEIPQTGGRQPITAKYLVQLPNEYDPYRRYPCIMTLGGANVQTTPKSQIEFWAGEVHPNLPVRVGQAARHGYIVIAPHWMEAGQATYNYSAREHAIVLKSLRDAIRRFSIDTDRVFLSGHFDGATAAWDIGQAHPEHWTGVIPISARAGKYINHYRNNGKSHLRWYYVNGGRDFASTGANATVWNRQLGGKGFDAIVVYYHGRGTERFSDELPNLFLWMSPQQRQFDVRKFECATMRPWDYYFWWLETDLTNHPRMIMPEVNWASVKNRSNWDIQGELKDNVPNRFYIRGALDNATVWLSPGLVDFSRNVIIEGQSGSFKGGVTPSATTLMEDVRTRADRQHPYWAKVVRRRKVWSVEE